MSSMFRRHSSDTFTLKKKETYLDEQSAGVFWGCYKVDQRYIELGPISVARPHSARQKLRRPMRLPRVPQRYLPADGHLPQTSRGAVSRERLHEVSNGSGLQ